MDAFLIPLGDGPLQPSTDTTSRTNTKVHPITQYCRDFVRKLPQVDDSGVPYKLKPSAGGKKGRPKESDKLRYQSITQWSKCKTKVTVLTVGPWSTVQVSTSTKEWSGAQSAAYSSS